jgi:two-component system, NarL family, nitrate/nitrite response regulator NarL
VAVLNVLMCVESRIYREGLELLLKNSCEVGTVEVCGDFSVLAETLARSRCDIVLMDVAHGFAGVGAVEMIATAYRSCRHGSVIALGLDESDDDILAYVEAGAAAFVTKNDSVGVLIKTISATLDGEFHAAPRLVRLMQRRLADLVTGQGNVVELHRLSHREADILGMVDQHMSNKQIARKLGLEVSTIKNHVHNIIVKLSVKNRVEAAAVLRSPSPARTAP